MDTKDTLTVKELIEQLKKVDENLPVKVSAVGINASDSWDANLDIDESTVDVFNGICRINFWLY